MGAQAAAGGVMAGSQLLAAKMQADALKMQGEWQEQQLKFNAQIADVQRKEIAARTDTEIQMRQRDVSQMLGAQKTAIAANGIDLDSEVSKKLERDTRETGRLDTLAIQNNAWREAWGLQVKSTDLNNQGNFARAGGNFASANTMLTGGLQALSSGFKGYADQYKVDAITGNSKYSTDGLVEKGTGRGGVTSNYQRGKYDNVS